RAGLPHGQALKGGLPGARQLVALRGDRAAAPARRGARRGGGGVTRRRVSPVTMAVLAIATALVALLAYGVFINQPTRGIDAALAAGKRPASPSVSLPRLGGATNVSLSDWRGKVVVLNYWA